MSIKFVSKNSNYMIVLKSGIEGSRVLGTQAVPGLYIKFQAGSVDIKEESVVKMLREHPSFGIDFVEVKQDEIDPYVDTREDIEPAHTSTEIVHGMAGKSIGAPKKITPEIKKLIEKEALKMLPDLLKSNPKILKDIILDLAKEMKSKETPKEEDSKEEVLITKTEKIKTIV